MNDLFTKTDYSLYSNAMTFVRRPYVKDPVSADADVVVLGVPLDMATSGRPGARMGPDAIRRASVNLAWEGKKFPWNFNLFQDTKVIDAGDLVFDCGDAEDFTYRLEAATSEILKSGKTMLALGGDHFITLPILRAYAKYYGEMALIHFDAHTDTYANGSAYDHGTMFYHAPKEGLISAKHSVQVGIRTEYKQEGHGFNVINAMQANDMSVEEIVANIRQTIGDKPVYLTFDIDCLDPAFAPGTGTPVCGGLNSDKALKIIRALAGINLVGMDVVEVSPPYDQSELTALAGATIALELLYVWASKPNVAS
ncbi:MULTISPECIES: agmatinase [unclassified Vibrio]|uniref:agmatinase n=1 Tax=unclassified Vibrio TaxID=2614977 RepID=UPI000B8E8B47|nr:MULTISPECIES: agmatinase [unclassified Vibrio]OXX71269.1 agmatinase [Vibrio sp. V03_P4A6T147]NAX43221.1 agmatinase [Vibrio sp. V25_P4S6T154]OXX47991.1 agmatinase [Vibrio sp. V17_P4S1T151]OXX61037.1 agmatinase [Vibrio sp. V15_P4S5T153]OXX63438.1 agmatinase [Vibrio sp. V20_P4S3T152]